MVSGLVFSLSALFSLIPAPLSVLVRRKGRDSLYWLLLAVAVWGPVLWAFMQFAGAWRATLSATLWVTIAASMVLFSLLTRISREAWRLTPLLLPYLFLLGVLATIWLKVPAHAQAMPAQAAWLDLHIAVSVATYALSTVAAVAAVAAFLQERALKAKRPNALTRLLPSVADNESLMVRLLIAAEAVLAVGLASGMAIQFLATGRLLTVDHKTLFSLLAFVVIAILLALHFREGVRGRVAARYVLAAYLLLTLGYPGVKFVTDILLG